MKRTLLFICTLLCANVIFAQTGTRFWEGDLEYFVRRIDWETYTGEVEVSDCNESVTSVNIPSTLTKVYNYGDGTYDIVTYSVTGTWSAFYNCSSLTSVTIPNSVTFIGDYAFYNCSSLTSVSIPNSVTTIEYCAFEDCSSLTSVTIGNSVTAIEWGTFRNCSSLTSVTIPNSVTSIGGYAFYNCSSLTSVTIPNSVTYIGDSAFSDCSSLTSVDIPNSVTSIDGCAFYNCSSLTSVNIGNSVTSIGYSAFKYCSSLTSIDIPNSVTYIGDSAFSDCSSLTSVNIGNSVTDIGYYAFYDCSSLTSVNIGNSVTDIKHQAFSGCSSLTSVTCLATNPPALGGWAFSPIGFPSTLYVPNGCRQSYENSFSWGGIFDCILELGSNNSIAELDVEVNNEEWGSVEVYEGFCGIDTLTAVVEEDCSKFLHWNDGDTNNPRVVNVTRDTSFTAIFKDPVLDTTINATIMQGETYNFNGQELSEEGVYNATVLSVAGCEINLTINLYVIPNNYTNGETSSLQETELEEIVFYPNPTKGLISFSKSIEKIEVVDISGKILLSFSNVREINIGDLPEGSYLLRLHSNENSVLRKIVKE
ncbi:MAG: leucine-rich repeat domain-containing protein [Bacteroidales bacterium]|nr:leucine-rich repeat domain-containing protein [Bacteroidales bacterium]